MPAAQKPNIHQRLLAITADAEVAKGGTAPGAVGGFAFHKIDDVEAMLKPLLVKHGVTALPTVADIEFTPNGSWNITTARVNITFTNADDPKDVVVLSSSGQGFDKQDKGAGKAISYATKNCYLSAFHLKGMPDNESDAHDDHVSTKDTWKRDLWNTAKENGWTGNDLAAAVKEEWQCDPANPPKSKRTDILKYFDTHTPEMHFEGKKAQDLEEIIPPQDTEPTELF